MYFLSCALDDLSWNLFISEHPDATFQDYLDYVDTEQDNVFREFIEGLQYNYNKRQEYEHAEADQPRVKLQNL